MLWGNDKAYVFIGSQYFRINAKTNSVDKGYPQPIKGMWVLPAGWTDGIDAAIPWSNGKVYFFKGNESIQYTIGRPDTHDPPKRIEDEWPGIWKDGIDSGMQWNEEVAYFFKDDVKAKEAYRGFPRKIEGSWADVPWREGDVKEAVRTR
jgi:Hemopexin